MPAACQPVPTFHGEPCPSIQLSHKPAAAEGGRTPDRHPPKADEPRTDTHPRRTNPGPTPTQGGRTPDRPPWRSGAGNPGTLPHRPSQPPTMADEPRTDTHPRRTKPGSTTMQ